MSFTKYQITSEKGMRNRFGLSLTNLVILTLYSVLFLGCRGEKKVKDSGPVEQNEFQSYKLDIKEGKIPLADLIQSVRITRLEETEASLLRAVVQVEFHEDKMIIPDNGGTFYVYSKNGKFLSKFNRKGDGPEEYSRLIDIWIEDGLIGIYSSGASINRYDLAGNLVSRDRLDERAVHVHPYKSGYALDMHYVYTQDSLKFSLVTVDEEMKLDKTFLPFEKYPGFRNSQYLNSFFTLDDDLFYLHTMSDTVYRLTADSVAPFIHYDFQEDWYFKPGIEVKRGFYEESNRKEQVWFVLNLIGENYIYLFTTLGPRMDYDFLVDRETSQSVSIDWRISGNQKLDFYPIAWNGDEFLISLRSSQLTDLLEQLDENQYGFTQGSTLEETESSENPVLVWIKFK